MKAGAKRRRRLNKKLAFQRRKDRKIAAHVARRLLDLTPAEDPYFTYRQLQMRQMRDDPNTNYRRTL